MNRRQAITTAFAAGTAVASAKPTISTTQRFSIPAVPTPEGASEELLDCISSIYEDRFEQFRNDVDGARDVFGKYPELVTSSEPHPDFARIVQVLGSQDRDCSVADKIMRPDEIVKEAERVVNRRREHALKAPPPAYRQPPEKTEFDLLIDLVEDSEKVDSYIFSELLTRVQAGETPSKNSTLTIDLEALLARRACRSVLVRGTASKP